MLVNLYKSVVPGKIAKSDDEIYEAVLVTIVTLDVADVDDEIDIGESLEEMNQVSFNVLIQHITKSFVKDFVKGFSDKVKAGVNENE